MALIDFLFQRANTTGMTRSCRFCEIVAGDGEADVVLDTDEVVSFLDANPAVEGHTLVLPKVHHAELESADPATVAGVWASVTAVSRALVETFEADGVSVFYTSGPLAGTVDHAHVHVMPRTADDDLSLALQRYDLGDEGPRLAAAIRGAIEYPVVDADR